MLTVLAWVGAHSSMAAPGARTGLASGGARTGLLAQPGTVAFLVVFGMAVILYFVFRSMSKHLRKVNQAAREEADAAAREEAAREEAAREEAQDSP